MNGLTYLNQAQRILFLQGPMGSFFYRLSKELTKHGKECYKINFNAGDRFFYHTKNSTDYTGTYDAYSAWLTEYIKVHAIDTVVCFGDCRKYHTEARKICQQLDVTFLAFEEGYLRPDYITFEKDGVNDNSGFEKADVYHHIAKIDTPSPTYPSFFRMASSACWYFIIWHLFKKEFPHYTHHRNLTIREEFFAGFRSFFRKTLFMPHDRKIQRKIIKHHHKQYFVVPLQVHNDSQIRFHSDYGDMTDFIHKTMLSFATNADPKHLLVIKHHPMDRGYRHYGSFIRTLSHEMKIQDRVLYVCDVHLPSLLKGSLGLITINSTTGLQALFHKIPVKVLGRAIYDMPNLTSQVTLDQFWTKKQRVNIAMYKKLRSLLVERVQLNGSFFGESPWFKLIQPANKATVQDHDVSQANTSKPKEISAEGLATNTLTQHKATHDHVLNIRG